VAAREAEVEDVAAVKEVAEVANRNRSSKSALRVYHEKTAQRRAG
jgi:hypothetical protein